MLAVFAAWWEVNAGHPTGAATYALLAVNAAALGIQRAVLRFGVSGLSTTYLTGTLTQFVASLHDGAHRLSTRSIASLIALISGAALGAVLAVETRRLMPIVPLGVVILVLVGGHVMVRNE